MKRIFISQPMNGLTDEEIIKVRDEAIEELREIYQFFYKNKELEIVSTTELNKHEIIPKNPHRLWWLGRAIQLLADVDEIYMCKGWEDASGCCVEKYVATLYNIDIRYQK